MTTMNERQNKQINIEKLQAQRQIYSDIKFHMLLIFIFSVLVPVLMSFFFKNIGCIPNVYGFCSVVFIVIYSGILKGDKECAAKIQEQFDTNVFKLKWDDISVGKRVDKFIIVKKSQKFIKKNPNYSGFVDWYTDNAVSSDYPSSIFYCQEQNLCWDSSLRKIIVLLSILMLFSILLITLILGLLNNITLKSFLTENLLLLAPVFLYFYNLIIDHTETIKTLNRLKEISSNLKNTLKKKTSCQIISECRILQTNIYIHRKSARPIPNWIHKITKKYFEKESAKRANIK